MKIHEVKTKKQIRDFLSLPARIYTAPNTLYVNPLKLHTKILMGNPNSPNKHFFVAYVDNKPVARIGAKVHKHNDKKYLHWGFFECVEGHAEAATELIKKVHSLYPDIPMRGPYHFRMEDPFIGTLTEGFDSDPSFLMTYNPPYYPEYLEGAGMTKIMDLFTYVLDQDYVPPKIGEQAKKAAENNVQMRWLDPSKMRSEVETIVRIFNDALSENWGFEEFVEQQVEEMYTIFKFFIDPRIVCIATVNGEDVGCLMCIPNYNPLLKSSKGRLTPGVLWNFFRKRKKMTNMRGYALGVKKKFHGKGIGSALVQAMYQNCFDKTNYRTCEISWVLASNGPMNELSQAMEGKKDKVYRVYEYKS